MLKFRRYRETDLETWNRFVAESKNGTFLFNRHYMEYHGERFWDFSLLVFDEQENLIGLVPANRTDGEIHSHAGLTYGGVISGRRMTTACMVALFADLRDYLANEGCRTLHYKAVPAIYHRFPAEEDRYALFFHGAELERRDVSSALQAELTPEVQKRRRRGAERAMLAGATVEESDDFASFWSVLEANLQERFDRKPVHSLSEIQLLHGRFPDSIRLYVVKVAGSIIGGTVMYLTDQVAHAQYIASDSTGREVGALDLLFLELFKKLRSFRYFDFGISTEENGKKLNKGLIEFKEGFGARAVVHDHYLMPLV
jgi:hypothetical protein